MWYNLLSTNIILIFLALTTHSFAIWEVPLPDNLKLLKQEHIPGEIQKKIHPNKILYGKTLSKENLELKLKQYFYSNPKILYPLQYESLKLKQAYFVKGKNGLLDTWYMKWVQIKKDGLRTMEVEQSFVSVTVKKIGKNFRIVKLSLKIYPEVLQIIKTKNLTNVQILAKAKQEFLKYKLAKYSHKIKTKEDPKLFYIKKQWRILWESTLLKQHSHLKTYVDEQTGEVFFKENLYFTDYIQQQHWLNPAYMVDIRQQIIAFNTHLHFLGRGVGFDPSTTGDNLLTLELPHLQIDVTEIDGSASTIIMPPAQHWTRFTNTTGHAHFALTRSSILYSQLRGKWLEIENDQGAELALSEVISPDTTQDFNFNSTGNNEYEVAQVNAYYHGNFIHKWLKQRGIGDEIDGDPLPALVNENLIAIFPSVITACNAFYDPTFRSLIFFKAGVQEAPSENFTCRNAAYDTIIYHEYGHFVDDMIGGITDRALSEGWGDVLASFASGQPTIGKNFMEGYEYIRTANNDYRHPYYLNVGAHTLGQAWVGFAWHLRENLINRYGAEEGKQKAENLVLPIFYAENENILEAVSEVALRDDDDGELSNGSPHSVEITQAAQRHQMDPFDFTPPSAISDLEVFDVSTNKMTLQFTAPGDETPNQGQMINYEIRKSTAPITEENFSSQTLVYFLGVPLDSGNPIPQIAGTIETIVIPRLSNDTVYYFAIKSMDDGRNKSLISNVASDSTLPLE